MSRDLRDQLKQQGLNPSPEIRQPPPIQASQGRGGPGGRPARREEPTLPPVPDPPSGGYFDEKGNLKLYYVSKSTLDPLAQQLSRNLKLSQLRRFFNHLAKIRTKLRNKDSNWDAEKVNVKSVSYFAANAAGRKGEGNIPDRFRSFLDRNVDMTDTEKDFTDGFMKHFEGLVGFASFYMRDQTTEREHETRKFY